MVSMAGRRIIACLAFLYFAAVQARSSGKDVDPTQIKKVHIVFMNHLDVGYDGIYPTTGFALNVINKYFTEYYPRAVSVAYGLRFLGYQERLVYTTHPWLLHLYLHCKSFTLASNVTLICPNQTDVDAMKMMIQMGDIAWHAGPMNMQYEVFDPLLLDMALNISANLDREFGITRQTPVVSQRDVPGMTKAVIPIMKKYNIAAISVGVNLMTSPPAVPPHPFVWKMDPKDSDEDGIIGFWHPGGYPGNPGKFPAKPGGMSVKDCVFAEDVSKFPEILCFAFRTDNSGPPEDANEVLNNYEVARGQFPNAVIIGSTLDQYVAALKASGTSYPTVIQEMGDTWIMGVQSDPKKVASYRAFARGFSQCGALCQSDDPRIINAVHFATKLPEHTWGLDTLNDFKNWTNTAFAKARSMQRYKNCEASWQEQRQFLDLAMDSLGSHPVTTVIKTELKQLEPQQPDLSQYEAISPSAEHTCPDGVIIQLASDGGLKRLYDPYNKVEWASDSARLGQILYSTYNESDYDNMDKLYDYIGNAGFHKTNSTQYAHPQSQHWDFKVDKVFSRKGGNVCNLLARVVPVDKTATTYYGAPPLIYIQYTSVPQTSSTKSGIQITVQLFQKPPTRLPEAVSFGFTPQSTEQKWWLSKLSSRVDPMDVMLNGSQYLHVINKGVYYLNNASSGLEILSLDVGLVTLGTQSHQPSVYPVPLTPLTERITTAAFNIYNNLWNTNYIYYYPYFQEDENFKARFTINFI